MPQQLTTTTENNFTKGLITEATGLNFPENAATDTDNCEYTLVGDVTRRLGINYEVGFTTQSATRIGFAVSSYKWNNVGGDGETQVVVEQIGSNLSFYRSSSATLATPLSTQILSSTVDLASFTSVGNLFDPSLEVTYADGNGYLFVFHPDMEPIYCTYIAGVVTANTITVNIRDFNGVIELNTPVNLRPQTLTAEHTYNLENQGWNEGNAWQGTSITTLIVSTGTKVFTTQSGLTINVGDAVNCLNAHEAFPGSLPPVPAGTILMSGVVTAYSGTSLTIAVASVSSALGPGNSWSDWLINPTSAGYINDWLSAVGNYPSDADVWWYFKDDTGVFNPGTTVGNVTLGTGPAPQGHFIFNAFKQQRSLLSSVAGLTDIITLVRPKTGTWFQGRVWYAGVDDSKAATGDAAFYTWTENIYFSQVINGVSDFGNCYQTNDPTSENLNGLLPTDGGVIQIQGAGSIYKLFPIQNGMLAFAANGVWFITGSQGIGFSADDYTITKISSVRSISSSSFIDVLGLPYFWNEEGIYAVSPAQQGGLSVDPLTVGTILTYYNNIPLDSKKYVKGAYDPINYVIQWVFKTTEERSVSDRYTFDSILNFNTYNKAFFPYSVDTSVYSINGIVYVSSPGGSNAPDPAFKYLASGNNLNTFAEEYDTSYNDWNGLPSGSFNYVSYFVTGYKLRGQGIKRFQPQYIQVYSRQNGAATSYKIQGIWDYANDPRSGRWSSLQLVTNALTRFDTVFRRHKIRGHGYALQFKITSSDGLPFDIQGWSVVDTVNVGT